MEEVKEELRIYCRKCQRILPEKQFFQAVDLGHIDSNGYMSVCKNCCNTLYEQEFAVTKSMEKSIHNVCRMLNIRYSESAVESTKIHLNTMIENGTTPSPVFSTYKVKLTASKKTMDKSVKENFEYEDVDTVFVTKETLADKDVPKELRDFWGANYKAEDIAYLQTEYTNFSKTHTYSAYEEIVLLKEVCYKLLEIKNARIAERSTAPLTKELRDIMNTLAISPNVAANTGSTKESDAFGLWIADIEQFEPAEWLAGEGHELYRDVGDTEKYFENYMVRPLKNLITGSKDFRVDDENNLDEDEIDFSVDGDEETQE